MERNLVSRARNAVQRWRLRVLYERVRPELSTADVLRRIDPAYAVAHSNRTFSDLLALHLSTTPRALWENTPAADAESIERARRGEWELLGRRVRVSPDIDWHADPIFGARWPLRYSGALSYYRDGGDLVTLWHLNRMVFLLDTAAAYRTTRDPQLATRVYDMIDSWCLANPYLVGVNWMSPLEVATRLAVWGQALAAVADAPLPPEDRCARLVRAVLRQADYVASHFSEWPIPNHHLMGEAAMLHAFAAYWPVWKDSRAWMARAEPILVSEVQRQVLKDGVQYECSVNYHAYALDFLLVYVHAKALLAEPPDRELLDRVKAMATAHMEFVMPSGRWPHIGDDSIDRFFVLAHALEGPALSSEKLRFEDFVRPAYASLIASAPWARDLLDVSVPRRHARHFAEAGISVARDEGYGLAFVHGPQHHHLFPHGHLHADAGSFELELEGVPFVVDAGTYVYFLDAGARVYFKGARAHNAPVVDDLESMRSIEPFRWESVTSGESLGFGVLADTVGVGNRRKLHGAGGVQMEHTRALVVSRGTVLVFDAIRARAESPAPDTHLAVTCFRTPTPPGTAHADGSCVGVADPRRFARVFESFSDQRMRVDAIDDPADRSAWYSPRYGELQRGTAVRVSAEFESSVMMVTAIRTAEISVIPVRLDAADTLLAIEAHGERRLIRVLSDPFSIVVGGRVVAGRGAETPRTGAIPSAHPRGALPSVPEWLDELAGGSS
jgi:Heparinase II/III N-terminus/Heparinase II/III-like protein